MLCVVAVLLCTECAYCCALL